MHVVAHIRECPWAEVHHLLKDTLADRKTPKCSISTRQLKRAPGLELLRAPSRHVVFIHVPLQSPD